MRPCRIDALAEAMHEDFGSRSLLQLFQRQLRLAAFVGAHVSEDLRMHALCGEERVAIDMMPDDFEEDEEENADEGQKQMADDQK